MTNQHVDNDKALRSVLEHRDLWLRAAQEAEQIAASGEETPFVCDVIERCRRMQYELAVDKYLDTFTAHAHRH